MAYADPLDPTTPDDSAFAGQGDDKMRELKRALRQRLATLVVNIDADPLVLLDGILRSAMFPADEIDGSRLKPGSVSADRLTSTGSAITDNSVYTAALQDLAVTHAKLALLAVEMANIADNAVGTNKLADDAVNTAKIVDAAINRPKLAAPMRGVLGRVTKGSFVVPAGNLLSGPTYHKTFNIAVATNGVASPDAMAILSCPVMNSGVLMEGDISGGNIVVNVRDYDNDGSKDMSGQTIHWMIVQAYEGAVPE